jgi:hypothetical protein
LSLDAGNLAKMKYLVTRQAVLVSLAETSVEAVTVYSIGYALDMPWIWARVTRILFIPFTLLHSVWILLDLLLWQQFHQPLVLRLLGLQEQGYRTALGMRCSYWR